MPETPNPTQTENIVVFDFDGTITTRDTFALFLRYYAGTPRWAFKIFLLLPVFLAYGLRIIDRNRVKAHVIRRFFGGEGESDVQASAKQFAQGVIPGLIRPGAQIELDKHKETSLDTLYICSASITPYLNVWASAQNIKHVLATELEVENGICTGHIEGANVWGPGKIQRIEAEFGNRSFTISEAYGDSRGDRELLRAAHVSHWRPFRVKEQEH